jgi:adenosylcobyric acid synthase
MKAAPAVPGTASDVGKSLMTTGLSSLLADAGMDVAPFKAQNMANQAGVTSAGLEMPRAANPPGARRAPGVPAQSRSPGPIGRKAKPPRP